MIVLATNQYTVLEAVAIVGGLTVLAAVIGVIVLLYQREESGRPVFPWGARMRVERAKARLELDAIEVKGLVVESMRSEVLKALQDGNHEAVKEISQATYGHSPGRI